MAHIVEVTVSGLAGRSSVYHQTLDPHVNVFFGQNGSGKTSLLRIINAAMNTESASLINVPFESAEVTIYSINHDCIYTYTLKKKLIAQPILRVATTPEIDDLETDKQTITFGSYHRKYSSPSARLPDWTVKPKIPGDTKTRWRHLYLPTSRLYMTDCV